MKVKILTKLVLLIIVQTFAQNKHQIQIGNQYTIESKVLGESRHYNIYLPPSYYTSNTSTFPVIYLMDGDNNFHHTTGVVEHLSGISEKIPEMIVVGIADKGRVNYTKNTTLHDEKKNPKGRSNSFLKFITTELKPYINKNFRVANFDILIGHSLGGYFTINALLNKPKSFNAFIAISPSLWKTNYTTKNKIETFYQKNEHLNRYLYLSLANEKAMGIYGFVDQLDIYKFNDIIKKNEPLGLDYVFEHFPKENHNSVRLITINNALKYFFKNYDVSTDAINNLKTFTDYQNIIDPYAKMIGKGFKVPNRQLIKIQNLFYNNNPKELDIMEAVIKNKYPISLSDYYNNLGNIYVNNKDFKKGITLLKTNCKAYPKSPEYLTSLGHAYFKSKNIKEALKSYKKALTLAKKQGARQWYINQLQENLFKKSGK